MNQKLTKIVALFMCGAMFALAGCGAEEVSNNESSQPSTEASVESTAPANTPVPSAEPAQGTTEASKEAVSGETPVAVEEPHSTVIVEDKVDAEINIAFVLPDLQAAGVVSATPDAVSTVPAVSGANVEIEKVESYADAFVVVTLSGKLDKVDEKDIVLKKYNENWYGLSASVKNMTVKESLVTVNDEGKTVIIYAVNDKMDGTRVVADTSEKKFADLNAAITTADNYLSWQMEHGGWDKGVEDQAAAPAKAGEKKNKFSGWTSKSGGEMGTIDNDATYTQMRHIAEVYRETGFERYRESVLKGLDFIFALQYESGGFAQVYPARGNYSDNVTFNDNAMINVLIMLEDMRDRVYPFDSDLIPDEYITKIEESIDKAIEYILKAQITSGGRLTAWCAQHHPETYEPVGARAYELPSISGNESVAVIKFLMNQEQTPEIAKAVESAIQWFKDSEVKGVRYDNKDANGVYFIEDAHSSIWYRFYDIETNQPIFCDRDGIKKHNITEIGEERRTGYSWAGTYPKKLLEIYDKHGYYAGKIVACVENANSVTADGKTLLKDSTKTLDATIVAK